MSIRILQVNLCRSKAALDLLKQTARERKADILLFSEQCKKPDLSTWYQDSTGRAGIQILNPKLQIGQFLETDRGHAWVEVEGLRIYSCYFSPNDQQNKFEAVIQDLVIAQLLFLQSESSKKPIHMYINSPGGVVTAGLGIYDTMQYVLPPVATWCVGQACSMASLLLASGAPGMRHSLPNARIMIHQPSGGAQGQATDIQIAAEEMLKLKKQINGLYAKHTGIDLVTLRK